MIVAVWRNAVGSTEQDFTACESEWDCPLYLTSISASWPLLPDSGDWCLGQTFLMAPQSLSTGQLRRDEHVSYHLVPWEADQGCFIRWGLVFHAESWAYGLWINACQSSVDLEQNILSSLKPWIALLKSHCPVTAVCINACHTHVGHMLDAHLTCWCAFTHSMKLFTEHY